MVFRASYVIFSISRSLLSGKQPSLKLACGLKAFASFCKVHGSTMVKTKSYELLHGQAKRCLEKSGYALQRATASPNTPDEVVQACDDAFGEVWTLYDRVTLQAIQEATDEISKEAVNEGEAAEEEMNSEKEEPMDFIAMATTKKAEVAELIQKLIRGGVDDQNLAEIHALVCDPNARVDEASRALKLIFDVKENPNVGEAIKTVEKMAKLLRDNFVLHVQYVQSLCSKATTIDEVRDEFLQLAKCYFEDGCTQSPIFIWHLDNWRAEKNLNTFEGLTAADKEKCFLAPLRNALRSPPTLLHNRSESKVAIRRN